MLFNTFRNLFTYLSLTQFGVAIQIQFIHLVIAQANLFNSIQINHHILSRCYFRQKPVFPPLNPHKYFFLVVVSFTTTIQDIRYGPNKSPASDIYKYVRLNLFLVYLHVLSSTIFLYRYTNK